MFAAEVAEDRISEFAVDFDVAFARDGISRRSAGGTGVTKKHAKKVGQEIGEDLRFTEVVDSIGADECGPMLELRAKLLNVRREGEVVEVGAKDVGGGRGVWLRLARWAP